jgi:RNA polymerase sigma factor (sigma-70 family)
MLRQAKTKERILDEYLVAAARLGDRRAFGLLAQRWNRKLLAHAWWLLADEESAKEAVQDAWTEIVRSIGKIDDALALPAWAYRIVSRRCVKLIGQAQRRRQLEQAIIAEPAVQSSEAEAAIEIEKLRVAIRGLPAGHRAAVALFHLEELSIAEVAIALDIPAGTVKSRLMYARHKLRAVLEGER